MMKVVDAAAAAVDTEAAAEVVECSSVRQATSLHSLLMVDSQAKHDVEDPLRVGQLGAARWLEKEEG